MELKRTEYFEREYEYENSLIQYPPSDNPQDNIDKILDDEAVKIITVYQIFDGNTLCFIDSRTYSVNNDNDLYKRVLKVDIMPKEANIPKGLIDLLNEKGFIRSDIRNK